MLDRQLNIEVFDKRRFNEIYAMLQGLQQKEQISSKEVANMEIIIIFKTRQQLETENAVKVMREWESASEVFP